MYVVVGLEVTVSLSNNSSSIHDTVRSSQCNQFEAHQAAEAPRRLNAKSPELPCKKLVGFWIGFVEEVSQAAACLSDLSSNQ